MRRIAVAVVLFALIGISSGCYHHHLRANGDRVNSSPFRKTLDASGGGKPGGAIVPPPDSGAPGSTGLPSSADCKDNGLYEVGITSKWKDAAATVFSFGRRSRLQVEWFCAKQPPVIGPRGLNPPPATPAEAARPVPSAAAQPPRAGSRQDGFTKRTVHAFFWGGLQQNLLPPPSAATKTPANCKSMRQVKLPMHYGYALITVFTAGIWSPMQVAWKCNEDPNGISKATAPAVPGAAPFRSSGSLPSRSSDTNTPPGHRAAKE